MFSGLGTESYFFNQVIFAILLGLFCLGGFRFAGRRGHDKRDNRKRYYSIVLSIPSGFLISFFLIDSIYTRMNIQTELSLPASLLVYWAIILLVGIAFAFLASLVVLKQHK